jgi:PAS domain-containing protein/class 3 adenylate cyclase
MRSNLSSGGSLPPSLSSSAIPQRPIRPTRPSAVNPEFSGCPFLRGSPLLPLITSSHAVASTPSPAPAQPGPDFIDPPLTPIDDVATPADEKESLSGDSRICGTTSMTSDRLAEAKLLEHVIEQSPAPPADAEPIFADREEEKEYWQKYSRLMKEVLDNVSFAVFIIEPRSEKIILFNKHALLTFNRLDTELRGGSMNLLLPRTFWTAHSGLVADFLNQWQSTGIRPPSNIVDKVRFRPFLAIRRKHGSLSIEEQFMAAVKITPLESTKPAEVPIAFMAQIQDTSQLDFLTKTIKTYSTILNSIPDGIIICDLDGKINFSNNSLAKILGWSLEYFLEHNADINWLISPRMKEIHARLLISFKRSLLTGRVDSEAYDIFNKERTLTIQTARDPLLVSISLKLDRNEADIANSQIIAIIRSLESYVPRKIFKEQIASLVVPKKLVKKFIDSHCSALSEDYTDSYILIVDLVGSTGVFKKKSTTELEFFLRKLCEECTRICEACGFDINKFTGDGVLIMGSEINEFDNPHTRASRAIYFAIALINWSSKNPQYPIRIGIAKGTVRSVIFPLSGDRICWEILGLPISEAERMQSHALSGEPPATQSSACQISQFVYSSIPPKLQSLFIKICHTTVKGFTDESGSLPPISDTLVCAKPVLIAYRNKAATLTEAALERKFAVIAEETKRQQEELASLERDRSRLGL